MQRRSRCVAQLENINSVVSLFSSSRKTEQSQPLPSAHKRLMFRCSCTTYEYLQSFIDALIGHCHRLSLYGVSPLILRLPTERGETCNGDTNSLFALHFEFQSDRQKFLAFILLFAAAFLHFDRIQNELLVVCCSWIASCISLFIDMQFLIFGLARSAEGNLI